MVDGQVHGIDPLKAPLKSMNLSWAVSLGDTVLYVRISSADWNSQTLASLSAVDTFQVAWMDGEFPTPQKNTNKWVKYGEVWWSYQTSQQDIPTVPPPTSDWAKAMPGAAAEKSIQGGGRLRTASQLTRSVPAQLLYLASPGKHIYICIYVFRHDWQDLETCWNWIVSRFHSFMQKVTKICDSPPNK